MRRAAVIVGLALLVGQAACRHRKHYVGVCETDEDCPKHYRCHERSGGEEPSNRWCDEVDENGDWLPQARTMPTRASL
jgi:hypothetical protein